MIKLYFSQIQANCHREQILIVLPISLHCHHWLPPLPKNSLTDGFQFHSNDLNEEELSHSQSPYIP